MFPVMPYVEAFEWVIPHMDDTNLVLHSESGSELATYYEQDMHTYYKTLKPREYVNTTFYTTWANLNKREIIKSWY